jgi:hypothetical protein
MCRDSPPWPQPLHRASACDKHHPSPPHDWTIHLAIQRLGSANACSPNMDRPANHDPGGFPAKALRTCPHRRPSRICPRDASSAKRLRDFGSNKSDDDLVETVATQVAALTYQSQMTASSMANTSQCAEQQFAHLASQQNMMHKNMHQIIVLVSTLSFNQSNAEHGRAVGNNFEGNGGCGCGHG